MLRSRAKSNMQSLCRPDTAIAVSNCSLGDPGEERSRGTATRVESAWRFMLFDSLPARRQPFFYGEHEHKHRSLSTPAGRKDGKQSTGST